MGAFKEPPLILIVDDEQCVVDVISIILTKAGYRVIYTQNSKLALQMFREHVDRLSLVITDLTMPDVSGTDLAAQMKAIRADIPIILCTGYGKEIGYQRARHLGISDCLGKPLLRREIVSAVQKALQKERENIDTISCWNSYCPSRNG